MRCGPAAFADAVRGHSLFLTVLSLMLTWAVAAPAPAAEPGSVLAFGLNSYGQLGAAADGYSPNSSPAPLTLPGQDGQVIALAAGSDHSLLVTSSGQLYAVGDDAYGQLGHAPARGGRAESTPSLVTLPGLSGHVVQVAAGRWHSLVLTSSGQLYSFGYGKYGELGTGAGFGSAAPNPTPTLVTLPGQTGTVTQIAAGEYHSLAATSTGQLYAFGYNRHGELGLAAGVGTPTGTPTPTLVPLPGENGAVTQLSAGRFHSLAVTSTGQLYAFGRDHYGELGASSLDGNPFYANPTPVLVTVPGATGTVTRVAAGGSFHSLILTSTNHLYAVGYNAFGQLGPTPTSGSPNPTTTPAEVTLPGLAGTITRLGAGSSDSMVVTSSGQLFTFGYNRFGQLGTSTNATTYAPSPTPAPVSVPAGTTIDTVATGATASHTLALVSDLAITTDSLPGAQAGSAYHVALAAAGGTAPLTWAATGLPAGLTLDSVTGAIDGTPAQEGTAQVAVTVSDAFGSQTTRTLALAVGAATPASGSSPPVVVTTVPPSGGGPKIPPTVLFRIVISHRHLRVLANGDERVRLICPALASRGCAGYVQLRSRVGNSRRVHYTLAAGQIRTYRLRLGSPLLHYLRTHRAITRFPVNVVVVNTGPGNVAGAHRKIHLTPPKKH